LEGLLRAVDRLAEWPDDVALRLAVLRCRREHVEAEAVATEWREAEAKRQTVVKANATRAKNRKAAKARLEEIRAAA
jgi:hypothetical protein